MSDKLTAIKDDRTAIIHLLMMYMAKQDAMNTEIVKYLAVNTHELIAGNEIIDRMNVSFAQSYHKILDVIFAEYGFLDIESLNNPLDLP